MPAYLGDISYCQYVLQMIAYELFPLKTFAGTGTLAFFVFLLSGSSMLQEFVARPGRVWWSRQAVRSKGNPALLLGPPCVMAVVVVVVSVVVAIATAPLEAGLGLPRVVVHQEAAAVDVDLRWHEQYRPQTDELGLLCRLFSCDQPDLFSRDDGPISATEYGTTNPSLLMYTPAGSAAPHLVRAARIHAVREVRGEGTYEPEPGVELVVTEVTTEWTSNIALVEEEAMPVADWQAWDPQKWGIIYDGTQKLHKVDSLVSSLLDERPWAPLCEPVPKYVTAPPLLLLLELPSMLPLLLLLLLLRPRLARHYDYDYCSYKHTN
jgi:hypothetical protein